MKTAVVIAAVILAFGIAGAGDYEEAKRSNELYCQMVAEGTWPDFNPETQCDMESGK